MDWLPHVRVIVCSSTCTRTTLQPDFGLAKPWCRKPSPVPALTMLERPVPGRLIPPRHVAPHAVLRRNKRLCYRRESTRSYWITCSSATTIAMKEHTSAWTNHVPVTVFRHGSNKLHKAKATLQCPEGAYLQHWVICDPRERLSCESFAFGSCCSRYSCGLDTDQIKPLCPDTQRAQTKSSPSC